ncbi:MAG: hypothetical protein LBJ94_00880 [Puniceicoccales bacterium]|nr:hypothetical protein [Puniceicoccales bacterium]
MKVGLGLCLVASMLSGCAGVDYGLAAAVKRDMERSRSIAMEVDNSLQILLYAGLENIERDSVLTKAALNGCLEITGWPDRMEQEYAHTLTESDVKNVAQRSAAMVKERDSIAKRINSNSERLAADFAKYAASHESLGAIKWFTGSLVIMLGFAALFWFLLRGRI